MNVESIELKSASVVWEREPFNERDIRIKISTINEGEGLINASFIFIARFGRLSNIQINGVAYISGTKEEFEKIRKNEQKQKEFKEELTSLISYYCITSSTLIASAFNLPAPIITPELKLEKEN